MISISTSLLDGWVAALLWPLVRVLSMISIAPILGHRSTPARVKVGLGLMLTIMMMPIMPAMPKVDVFTVQGLFIVFQQVEIGLAIGFSMRLVFAAVDLGGQLIGMTMGLGFASFFDPQSEGQSTALNQLLVLLTMLIFLSLDGHLLMISAVAESFYTMPVSLEPSAIDVHKMANWGETIFREGLLLAMPAIAALLITNMALAVLTRTAPQLNLFGIGFPVTLSIGFVVVALTLPGMMKPIENMIEKGASNMREVAIQPSNAVAR